MEGKGNNGGGEERPGPSRGLFPVLVWSSGGVSAFRIEGEGSENKGGGQGQQCDKNKNRTNEKEDSVKRKMLKVLLKEEEELKKTVEGMKVTVLQVLAEVNKGMVKKHAEIAGLWGMIGHLRRGGSRVLDSKRTADKSNLNGKGNKGPTTGQGRSAELVFPEQIWKMILDQLTDPKDLKNCSTTCTLFKKILGPPKTVYLFPKLFPLLCPYLGASQILPCRQVCKDWSVAVDTFLENHPSLRPFDEKTFDPKNPAHTPPMGIGVNLYKYSNLPGDLRSKQFLEKMKKHPRNPFIGRAVIIQLNPIYGEAEFPGQNMNEREICNFLVPEEAEARRIHVPKQQHYVWKGIFQFLETFGRHIWYLSFEINRDDTIKMGPGRGKLADFLTQNVFHLCPNLRRIRLVGNFRLARGDRLPSIADFASLPPAPHLESLQLGKARDSMGRVIEGLLWRHHKQLKKLHITGEALPLKWIYEMDHVRDPPNLFWPNLTELHIEEDMDETWDVEPYAHWMPQLRKLTLSPFVYSPRLFDFQLVMKAVIKLSATTNLSVLRIFKGFEERQIVHAPAHLFAPPSLKTLEVEDVDWENNFTFLLRFPFLENLIVFLAEKSVMDKERSGDEICYAKEPNPDYWDRCGALGMWSFKTERERFHGLFNLHKLMWEKRVYESKVWEVLPRLKIITFQRDVYTREGYERVSQQQREKMKPAN